MKINKLSLCLLILFSSVISLSAEEFATNAQRKKASWTMLVYIAADNSLASFASYNINDMAAGLASSQGVNILVQWDKPNDNKTWRYRITPGGKVDIGTLSSEMGYNPEQELVNAMQWAYKNYPADNYALVLWDHGSGIEDFSPATAKTIGSCSTWLNLTPSRLDRGILYDDSQKTCLTNAGLTNALIKIKKIIGKNLDLIAMDACLMAMVEVAYQMKGLVNIFVGSEQTIPGYGYPYSKFIKPLSLNPASTSALILAQNMVAAYSEFYTSQEPTTDFTLSAIDVTSIDSIKKNIDQFISAIAACSAIDAEQTKTIIIKARKASTSFEMAEYIDLYSFYANILNQTKKISPKSSLILGKLNLFSSSKPSEDYQAALTTLNTIIQDGLNKISTVVLQKTAGPVYVGTQGISIYYPSDGQIDTTYKQTIFAQNTDWIQFIETYNY